MATIEVTFTTSQDTETGKFTLAFETTSSTDIQPEIFILQRDVNGDDNFYSVANVAQVLDFPKTEPEPGSTFFLVLSSSVEFDIAQDILDSKEDIKACIQKLIDDFTLVLDDILNEEIVLFSPSGG